ncbi:MULTISPECIES: hypothetical protein [unclassified Enterococcus]|uniref:hypothetical protein n=1 Tax=unclassified Enterococcus TaxID=2608891 RepID=UPI000A3548C0|nr:MULTISPECIES: hypothetical protein [unclassified Enterococcus]OTO77414.1 hypothetical protein A5865_001290 [Enterococcus sp. 12E11_DIV0728]OUZ16408.1 hypothetical protein A5868_001329 [Enterococcus sp. 12F9_DIV0723]
MRREVARPKEAITNIKQGRFDFKDVLFIVGSPFIGMLSQYLVPEILNIPYILAYPVIFYLLLSPSDIHGKKNYQVAIQVLLKDRKVYHSITPPEEDETYEI